MSEKKAKLSSRVSSLETELATHRHALSELANNQKIILSHVQKILDLYSKPAKSKKIHVVADLPSELRRNRDRLPR